MQIAPFEATSVEIGTSEREIRRNRSLFAEEQPKLLSAHVHDNGSDCDYSKKHWCL